jgi:hypothetical protein
MGVDGVGDHAHLPDVEAAVDRRRDRGHLARERLIEPFAPRLVEALARS